MGERIWDKFITGTDDMVLRTGSNSSQDDCIDDGDIITIKKSHLIDMISKIVANIVNKR